MSYGMLIMCEMIKKYLFMSNKKTLWIDHNFFQSLPSLKNHENKYKQNKNYLDKIRVIFSD